MLKLSRASVIGDIEFIIDRPVVLRGKHQWISKGTECTLSRHSFDGEEYGFSVEVLRIRMRAGGKALWELVIVYEFWHATKGESLRATKWLKLLSGKSADVLKWIAAHRSAAPEADDD